MSSARVLPGTTCALMAAKMGIKVCLITKRSDIYATNTNRAQGGIVYKGSGDSPQLLVDDIMRAGRDINSVEAVEFLATRGPEVVKEMLIDELKVDFTHLTGARDEDFDLTREGRTRSTASSTRRTTPERSSKRHSSRR